MLNNTQSNSRARLKNDTIGDEGLKRLYAAYADMDVVTFRLYCIDMVESGGGKQDLKNQFIEQLEKISNKDRMLQKVNNFALAGMGLGV